MNGQTSVLINHPHVGSIWLDNARIVGNQVEGETWDDSDIGSALLPDDYQGEPVTMHFPLTCVRKWRKPPKEVQCSKSKLG